MSSLYWIPLLFITLVIVSPAQAFDCIQDWKRRVNDYVERRSIEKRTMDFLNQFRMKARQMGYDPEIIDKVLTDQFSKITERVESRY
ncbi:hypothetical protein ACFLXI_03395 [Chloroflexota bacterium]